MDCFRALSGKEMVIVFSSISQEWFAGALLNPLPARSRLSCHRSSLDSSAQATPRLVSDDAQLGGCICQLPAL